MPVGWRLSDREGQRSDREEEHDAPEGGLRAVDVVEAERWVDRGREAMEAGDEERALQLFQRAVDVCPIPAALNNLALMVLDHRKDPAQALRILQPNLQPAAPDQPAAPLAPRTAPPGGGAHPFAHATATRCYHQLGDLLAARRHLEAAVRAFEQGPDEARFPGPRRTWLEYTAVILHAAGTLEDDRLAWDLYRRWSAYHVLPQSHYFGGIAAFNLRRFQAAARAWRQIEHRPGGWGFVAMFVGVAEGCEAGLVPPFRLPYDVPHMEPVAAELERARGDQSRVEDLVRRLSQDPLHRMLLLDTALSAGRADRERAGVAMRELVANNGEWGEQLARAVLLSNRTTMDQKMDAAQGLVRAGAVKPGQTVRMHVEGRVQDVTLREMPVELGPDPQLDAKHREAIALRDAGKVGEAKEMLQGLLLEGERFYAPAAITYANLLRQEGELKEARRYLEMARQVMPGEPAVLFNLAGLSVQEGDLDQAARLLASIRTDDPGMAELVRNLRDAVRRQRRR